MWRPQRRHTPGVKPIFRGFIILSIFLFLAGIVLTIGVLVFDVRDARGPASIESE